MKAVAVIPARYASTRLPGKPLLNRTGKPLIIHVAERAAAATRVDQVIVATDDSRILDAVRAHGFEAAMTRADHPNGTSRIAEVARSLPEDVQVIVNVQGDEPQIDPHIIDSAVELLERTDAPMSTVASPFADDEDPADPNIVKVVCDRHGMAMYFSRALIPYDRDGDTAAGADRPRYLKHIGLYAYRRPFLPEYVSLSPTPAEESEKLEQLRALEHGYRIAVAHAVVRHHGIDTADQYETFVEQYLKDSAGGS